MSSPEGNHRADDLDVTVPSLQAGSRVFNRYTLGKVLGRGGMGVVWLARDETLNRNVALKFLPDLVATNPEAVRELKRETNRCLELTHPNIIRIYSLLEEEDHVAIAMELVEGKTLSQLKSEQECGCFDVEQIERWVNELCGALAHAHEEARIVHRDLKPLNIMVNDRGRIKVGDFGISRSVSESASRVTVRPSSGTPPYMSPEQMLGADASISDDIYSLGATIFDLLTGKPPFYQGDIVAQAQHRVPPSMSERRKSAGITTKMPIDAKWEIAVAKCLAKDPRHRPRSVEEVRQMLFLGTHAAFPHVGAQRSGPAMARRLALCAAGLGLIALGAAGLRWLPGQTAPLPGPKTEAALAKTDAPVSNAFSNSLGMEFISVPGTGNFLSKLETRVRDFTAFTQASGYDATGGMSTTEDGSYKKIGATWMAPGFEQSPEHPVVGVNLADAKAFCEWLTTTERQSGRIKPDQRYRLPLRSEWQVVNGGGRFAWGAAPVVPAKYGNLAGAETTTGKWRLREQLENFQDDYPRTAPAGSFTKSDLGFFDLVGNVQEWSAEDAGELQGIVLGSSWADSDPVSLESDHSDRIPADTRTDYIGFRCILETHHNPNPTNH